VSALYVCGSLSRDPTVGCGVHGNPDPRPPDLFVDQRLTPWPRYRRRLDRNQCRQAAEPNRPCTADIPRRAYCAVADSRPILCEAGSCQHAPNRSTNYGILGARPVDRQNAGSANVTEDFRSSPVHHRSYPKPSPPSISSAPGPAVACVATRTAKHDVHCRARQDCRGTRPQLLDKSSRRVR